MAVPVTLIFDVGKTNKKVLLFDETYEVIAEETTQLKETVDEDGFPCEDVNLLTKWIKQKIREIYARKDIAVHAINFSAYGASFVHIDAGLNICTPLYNYLKPFPELLKHQFYNTYGDEKLIAKETASPVLGSLNSGMQLYRLKYEKPSFYNRIQFALHLPQYLSFIVTKKPSTDISSVGCHTNLWNFEKNDYHDWVYKESLNQKFAVLYNGDKILSTTNDAIKVGIGLHDSSAALIPYLTCFKEPFILISTGTWNISLNPFNLSPLTTEELKQDCLCYLSYKRTPVKAARLFAGYEHEQQVKRLAEHFHKKVDYYKSVSYDHSLIENLNTSELKRNNTHQKLRMLFASFAERQLQDFKNYEEAYHQLMIDLVAQQIFSTKLVLSNDVKKIFVDGGFSNNAIYMNLLASGFPGIGVYAADVAQASALGAAIVLDMQSFRERTGGLIKIRKFNSKIIKESN